MHLAQLLLRHFSLGAAGTRTALFLLDMLDELEPAAKHQLNSDAIAAMFAATRTENRFICIW